MPVWHFCPGWQADLFAAAQASAQTAGQVPQHAPLEQIGHVAHGQSSSSQSQHRSAQQAVLATAVPAEGAACFCDSDTGSTSPMPTIEATTSFNNMESLH